MKDSIESSKSSLAEIYKLFGATTPLELQKLYTAEDQKLMKSGEWDYNNPDLIINQAKELLEDLNPTELSSEELEWREEILWFWYHHAISCAMTRYKDREAAKEYGAMALAYKSETNPNNITELLYLLANDKIEEAEQLASKETVDPDTAKALVQEYKEGLYF